MRSRRAAAERRFAATLKVGGKTHHLGRWGTPAEATRARDRAALFLGLANRISDVAARTLTPASPAELRREARLAFRARTRSSRYWGVSRNGRRWLAYLFHGGRRIIEK